MKHIADNEFSEQFTGDMPTGDTMYHHYQKDYNKLICVKCGDEFYRKKTEAVESDLCGKCLKENLNRVHGSISINFNNKDK